MTQLNFFGKNLFSGEMILSIHMFAAGMKFRILAESDSTLTVRINCGRI